jgi:hypothetical protein
MYEHGYSRCDLRKNTRRPVPRGKDHFIWPHRAGIALRGGAGLGLGNLEACFLSGSLIDSPRHTFGKAPVRGSGPGRPGRRFPPRLPSGERSAGQDRCS